MTAKVVVDLGSDRLSGFDSSVVLADRFQPERLYGFDPRGTDEHFRHGPTEMMLSTKAAWIYDGEVGFSEDGVASCLVLDQPLLPPHMQLSPQPPRPVECFDLAGWLHKLGEPVVLKLDVEGAEYALLERLLDTGALRSVELLLVEWHSHRVALPFWLAVEDWEF